MNFTAALAVPCVLAGSAAAVPVSAVPVSAGAAVPGATAEVDRYGWQLAHTAAPGQADKVTVTASRTTDGIT
ncbi:hypothetical protein [Streptomyces sp. NPDC006309]|uniref:hypothetical protein n=1 Tax=Streptomyces sp. NPDC006309 TaxID=3156749 RepID=UPI0033BD725D